MSLDRQQRKVEHMMTFIRNLYANAQPQGDAKS